MFKKFPVAYFELLLDLCPFLGLEYSYLEEILDSPTFDQKIQQIILSNTNKIFIINIKIF